MVDNLPSILMLHNRYQYAGGEDKSTETEVYLLRQAGHRVTLFEEDNHRIKGFSQLEKLQLFFLPLGILKLTDKCDRASKK